MEQHAADDRLPLMKSLTNKISASILFDGSSKNYLLPTEFEGHIERYGLTVF